MLMSSDERNKQGPVLVVAPHADDETLGMGGTIARLAAEGRRVVVAIVTGHGEGEQHPLWPRDVWRTVRAEAEQALAILGVEEIVYRNLPAVLVPDCPVHAINATIQGIFDQIRPETLFVPFAGDQHGDHRAIAYACSVAWRPVTEAGRGIAEVFMYETLSETHWSEQPLNMAFVPNAFIDISGAFLEKKIEALGCYASQMCPFPDCRSVEAVEAQAKWRGSLVGVKAAEAFVQVKRLARAPIPQNTGEHEPIPAADVSARDRFDNWCPPMMEHGKVTKYIWMVQHPENLSLGHRSDIGAFTYMNAKCGITIEPEVQLGSHCSIYSVSTIDDKQGPVVLKRNCRVGSHSTIMPGVTIGENAVVGAHSFVNRDVSANTTVVGVPAKPLTRRGQSDAAQRNVLVIDDDPAWGAAVVRSLAVVPGIVVATATDGAVGLDLARRQPPDLILLDIRMPGRDGFDVLRDLKRTPETRGVSVIMVTAVEDAESRQAAMAAEAEDYLTKPVLPDRLRDLVSNRW